MFPPGSIIVANKRELNLRELLQRSDPYNIAPNLGELQVFSYMKCNKKCDSCDNFVDDCTEITSKATGRKFKIRKNSSCTTANVIYLAYCLSCGKQGVGSTTKWKARLANYKSHISKRVPSCRIVRHFLEDCNVNPIANLRFVILDVVDNVDGMGADEIDALLLSKEKFWIGTLVTHHHGLNGFHDWNRSKRSEREK